MKPQDIFFFHHNFDLLQNAPEEIYNDVAERILPSCGGGPISKKTAIYLFTPDAGAYYSVRLWENALAHGPDLANPKNFAWTLASAPASFLGQLLKAQGPNITLIGGTENLMEIEELIKWHASQGLIETAIVIHLQNNYIADTLSEGFCRGAVISLKQESPIDFGPSGIRQFFLGTNDLD